MDGKRYQIRIGAKTRDKLTEISRETKWNRSEIVRRLIDSVEIKEDLTVSHNTPWKSCGGTNIHVYLDECEIAKFKSVAESLRITEGDLLANMVINAQIEVSVKVSTSVSTLSRSKLTVKVRDWLLSRPGSSMRDIADGLNKDVSVISRVLLDNADIFVRCGKKRNNPDRGYLTGVYAVKEEDRCPSKP